MTKLTTKEEKLQKLKPAVAPIAQEAPKVTSGSKKEVASFAPLVKFAERTARPFKISYGKRSARLLWPGLSVSSLELIQLLKNLPRANRIHIAVRAGENTKSLAYDGKLYKSKLAPPDEDGLLLYWKQAPQALAELEHNEPEQATAFEPVKSEKRNGVTEEPAPEKPALEKAKKNAHIDLAKRLAESPRFQAAYQALKDDKPSLPKMLQLLEILCHGGGQMALHSVVEKLGLLEHQVTTLVSHLDTILHKPGEYLLSLSIDRKVLLLDLERLSRSFALELSEDDIKVVRAETIEGEKRSVRLPVEVKVKERRALEALLRYGRLSEQELSQITSSRRIGGMLERLLSTLEGEGFHGLAVVGEGAEGRIFSLQAL